MYMCLETLAGRDSAARGTGAVPFRNTKTVVKKTEKVKILHSKSQIKITEVFKKV